eukprot:6189551-Pleurochrysis_carterae.AAC.1
MLWTSGDSHARLQKAARSTCERNATTAIASIAKAIANGRRARRTSVRRLGEACRSRANADS